MDSPLFRRWVPPGRDKEVMAVDQLVLPTTCRGTVMSLAHSIPLAGHLAKKKTTNRILQHFYFGPNFASLRVLPEDIWVRVPLMPLPTIRITENCDGCPLPRSRLCAGSLWLCYPFEADVEVKEDWDVMLPYLLFAYREVPQASTGFSPFELLYGNQVRGP